MLMPCLIDNWQSEFCDSFLNCVLQVNRARSDNCSGKVGKAHGSRSFGYFEHILPSWKVPLHAPLALDQAAERSSWWIPLPFDV